VVTRQLQVERRTAKERWPETDVLPLSHAGTVLYNTKSLDGIKANTNPKTNPNPNTNPIQLFYAIFEHRPMIFKLASFVRFSHRSNTVLLLTQLDKAEQSNISQHNRI